MGHSDRKKKKRDSSSSSSSSSSTSTEDSDRKSSSISSDDDSKRKIEKDKKKRKSYSDEDKRTKSKHEDIKKSESNKIKKTKYDDAQKSKWDSPAENVSKSTDRRGERIKTQNKDFDRNDEKDHRRYQEKSKYDKNRRDERQRDNYNDRRHDERHHNDRHHEERHDDRDRYNRHHGRNDDRKREYDDKIRSNRHRSRDRSRSKEHQRDNSKEGYKNKRNQKRNEDNENYDWGKKTNEDKKAPVPKEKPNFGLSGKLAEETNTYRGVVIKYSEPAEARKPKRRWRLYPFKGEKALQTLYIHRESAYLMGRDRKVVDFPLDHPSCSKQHAVLQYRLVPFTRDDGSTGKRVRPYLIDLDSANGTFINNKKMDPRKYVELLEKDVIKFGFSSREYVLLHENSKDEMLDDDVKLEDEEVLVKEEPQET